MADIYPQMVLDRPAFSDWLPLALPCAGWHVEPKLDGMWGQLVCMGSAARLYSRHGRLKHQITLTKPTKTRHVLHGEWLASSHWAHKQGLDKTLHLFDLTMRGGIDVCEAPAEDRRRMLLETMDALGLSSMPAVRAVPRWPASMGAALWQSLVMERGYEGLVCKKHGSAWGDGWARIKRVFSIDYVCLGANPGRGRHAGNGARSIRAGLYQPNGTLQHVGNVSGLTDALRRELHDNPSAYAGLPFEASGKGLFPSGALRHPNFIKWRPSYNPQLCVMP